MIASLLSGKCMGIFAVSQAEYNHTKKYPVLNKFHITLLCS